MLLANICVILLTGGRIHMYNSYQSLLFFKLFYFFIGNINSNFLAEVQLDLVRKHCNHFWGKSDHRCPFFTCIESINKKKKVSFSMYHREIFFCQSTMVIIVAFLPVFTVIIFYNIILLVKER